MAKTYKIRALVKRTDEEIGHVTAISDRLKNLQRTVDGYIECVTIRHDPHVVVICNEEARLLHLPYNCTVKGRDQLGEFDCPFFGDIIVVGADGDEFCDLPEEVTRKEWASWLV